MKRATNVLLRLPLLLTHAIVIIASLTLSVNTVSQTNGKRLPELADFSSHQRLEISGDTAAYRFTLPAPIYEAVPPSELNFIGVFNGQGNLIPWQRLPTPPDIVEATEVIPLGFFDGEQHRHVKPATERLSIYRNKESVSINLDLTASFGEFPETGTDQFGAPGLYYADLSQIPDYHLLRKLDFSWQTEQQNLLFDVEVSASADFKQWQTLGRGRLISLQQGANAVQIKQVRIKAPNHPYLRIEFSGSQAIPPLQSITGHFLTKVKSPAISPWQPVQLQSLDEEPGYEFSTGGSFLLQQLRILSPSENSIGRVSVYTWQREQWTLVSRTDIAQLKHAEPEQQRTVIDLASNTSNARENLSLRQHKWRIIFSKESTDYLNTTPAVAFNYHLEDIAFIRQGDRPFTLAYGLHPGLAEQLSWPDWRNNPLFPDTDQQSKQVDLGEVIKQKPKQIADQPYDLFSTTNLFWAGMIIFVSILLLLAFYLFRETQKRAESERR